MQLVTHGAIKGLAVTTTAAFVSCTTWLVGMIAIMASQAMEPAHAFQPFVLA
jgi:hypothetical protein